MDNSNYGCLEVDFQPQNKVFISLNTAYLKVWFVKLKKYFWRYDEHWLSHILWKKFKIDYNESFSQIAKSNTYILCSNQMVNHNCCR